jgi:predicted house-cleaning noncanonical NTP pyrophosphatase (MazG superfamily)
MNKRRELLMAGIPTGDARAFQRMGKMSPRLYIDLGGDAPAPPDPNPGMIESAEAARDVARMQQETAKEYLQFSKDQYTELKPIIDRITTAQLESMDANQKRAEEYANFERTTFRPLEQKLVDRANEYSTDENRERLASQGIADVREAYEQQRKQALDTLARFGVNPNSQRFAAINAQLGMREAADSAGVANRARTMAEDKGTAMLYDAAALGRGLATNASTAYGVANAAGNSASGNASSGMGLMGNAFGQASNMMGGAASALGTAGNIYGNEFGARMQGYNASMQNQDDGFGSLLGFGARLLAAPATGGTSVFGSMLGLADGGDVTEKKTALHVGKGPVSGPGGPVDDKIDAKLSDGEYVLPADTVKAIGKDKLDKLVKQTHTPAAVQRRQALKKG